MVNNGKKRAMVMSVGLPVGDDKSILNALTDDIRNIEPDRILFLATDQSRSFVDKIMKAAKIDSGLSDILLLSGPNDLHDSFTKSNQAIRRLLNKGFESDQIAINYTSGTKVMTSGLVVAATINSCKSLRYIMRGKNNEGNNSFTTSPRSIYNYINFMRGFYLFEHFRFTSAGVLLNELDDALLDEVDSVMLNDMRILSRVYFSWENFRYAECVEAYEGIKGNCKGIEKYYLKVDVLEFMRRIASNSEEHTIEPLMLVDIFNNAVRRSSEGKFDDAIIRCYRVLEMLAQWVLQADFEIDTDDLNTKKVPAKYRSNFEALRSADDGLVKIGLRKSFELVHLLEHPLGEVFWNHADTHAMLETRGRSTLAHGFNTINKEFCLKFIDWTEHLLESQVPDFNERKRILQFDWLSR